MSGRPSPMRIAFVSPDEPFLMPVFYRRVLPRLADEVVALVLVRPIYKGSGWTSQARRFVGAFGVRTFLAESVRFAAARALDLSVRLLRRPSRRTVRGLARHYGLPLLEPHDVNEAAFVEAMRDLSIDLIVSVACPQLFDRELLKTPRYGCVNVHSALLPHHRGMLPTFWALADGDSQTGVTVHTMSEAIDEGEIVGQVPVPIDANDSLHSLMVSCKLAAADLVVRTVEAFRTGTVATTPQPPGGEYHSFPTSRDVARFRAAGRRVR